ncbi:MAG: orotidine-5'-phosphate decarboxylase [Clostridia bacterium]|nr:orotidine-5'-phosphate decarboxylase [Clostridia bacterium]
MNFADAVIESIIEKKSYCVVGLDPNFECIPQFIKQENFAKYGHNLRGAVEAVYQFNKSIIDSVFDLVPAVKLQSAYYEVFGREGIEVFQRTSRYAKQKQLVVIGDVKRNDIGSTAEQYSKAYLGMMDLDLDDFYRPYEIDAITVNPYLGTDGIEPFVNDCNKYDRGIFILVSTSNKSSIEIQHLRNQDGRYIYEIVAEHVNEWGKETMGRHGYSSVGAVVGATFPQQAQSIRKLIKNSIFLVPGFGFQGADAEKIACAFNHDGLGAIINSSRAVIFSYMLEGYPEKEYQQAARKAVIKMTKNINETLAKAKKLAW